jgi:hypothetical protein
MARRRAPAAAPVTGVKPAPGAGWADEMAEAARLALPGEWLPAALPAVMSNTKAAVSAYAEAITDGIRDQLRLRLFESIWVRGRNLSSPYEVRRVVTELAWPADPIYPHLISPDLPRPLLHDLDVMRILRRSGGTVTPDGGLLTTAAYLRARQWRQQCLALPEPVIPAVIGPDGAIQPAPTACAAWPGSWVRPPSAGLPLRSCRAWRQPARSALRCPCPRPGDRSACCSGHRPFGEKISLIRTVRGDRISSRFSQRGTVSHPAHYAGDPGI